MRRLIGLFGLVLLFGSACASTEEESEVTQGRITGFSEEFIEQLFTVENANLDFESMSVEEMLAIQDEYEPFLTKEAFDELSARRFLMLPEEVASQLQNSISVENITFDNFERDEDDVFTFDHLFTLIFHDETGEQVDEVEITGQMTVEGSKESLKISRYHDNKNLIEKNLP